MKAKRVKKIPKFNPIEVLIETKEELEILWHLLNLGPTVAQRAVGSYQIDDRVHTAMWNVINTYCPHGQSKVKENYDNKIRSIRTRELL